MSDTVQHKDTYCVGCNQPCVASALTEVEDKGLLCHFCLGGEDSEHQHMLAVRSTPDETHLVMRGPTGEARLSITAREINLMVRM
jgi:hypothetical protein